MGRIGKAVVHLVAVVVGTLALFLPKVESVGLVVGIVVEIDGRK